LIAEQKEHYGALFYWQRIFAVYKCMTTIYESPDHGETVTGRLAGTSDRWTVSRSQQATDLITTLQEDKLWGDIRRKSLQDPVLEQMLARAVVWYKLKYS